MSKRKDSNTGATYLLIITAYIFSLNFFGVMLYAISDKIEKTNPLRQLVLNNYSSFLIASIIIVVLGFISIEYVTSLMVNVVLSFIALQFYPNKYIAIILIGSGILWMFADPEIFRFSYLSKKKNKNNSSNDDMIYYTGAFLADVLRYIPYMVFLFTVYCWRVDMQKQREQFYYNHEEFLLKTGVLGTFICLFYILAPIFILLLFAFLQRYVSFKLGIAEKIYNKILKNILYIILFIRVISILITFYLIYLCNTEENTEPFIFVCSVIILAILFVYTISRFKIISRQGAKTMNERVEELYNAVNDMGDGNLPPVSREEIKEYLKNK